MTSPAIPAQAMPPGAGAMPAPDPEGGRPAQARALRSARVSRHMTQDTLASAAGVSSRTVIRAERGDEITVENLRAICAVLDLDAMAIVGTASSAPPERASAPEAEATEAEADPRPPATGMRRLKRFATRRWAVIALASPMVMYALTDCAGGRIFQALSLDGMVARQVSAIRATGVAGRVNVVLGKLSRGEAPDTSDLGPNWDFVSNWCSSPGLLERSETCGVSADLRMVVRTLDADGLDLAIGPVDDAFLEAFAMQLAAPPGATLKVSISPYNGSPTPGALWFDPRGVDPRNLPRVASKAPYLSVRVHRSGGVL